MRNLGFSLNDEDDVKLSGGAQTQETQPGVDFKPATVSLGFFGQNSHDFISFEPKGNATLHLRL